MKNLSRIDVLKICFGAAVFLSFGMGYDAYTKHDLTAAMIWAFVCAISVFALAARIRRGHYLSMRLKQVDQLSGNAFEEYLRAHFKKMGYRVRLTEESHDYGADLILKRWGETVVVQAKRYERHVGMSAVQEVIGAVACYEADRAMVVTNHGFTKSAWRLARHNDVELWGREELKKYLNARE